MIIQIKYILKRPFPVKFIEKYPFKPNLHVFFGLSIRRGGGAQLPLKKIGLISQMVKASLPKFSDIFCLPIPLDLSLFGARSHT